METPAKFFAVASLSASGASSPTALRTCAANSTVAVRTRSLLTPWISYVPNSLPAKARRILNTRREYGLQRFVEDRFPSSILEVRHQHPDGFLLRRSVCGRCSVLDNSCYDQQDSEPRRCRFPVVPGRRKESPDMVRR